MIRAAGSSSLGSDFPNKSIRVGDAERPKMFFDGSKTPSRLVSRYLCLIRWSLGPKIYSVQDNK